MAALLIKEAVNQTQDNMGFHNSLNACFTLHELNHSHWAGIHENKYPVGLPEDGLDDWRNAPPVVVGSVVVATPVDCPELIALDLSTGALRWSSSHQSLMEHRQNTSVGTEVLPSQFA